MLEGICHSGVFISLCFTNQHLSRLGIDIVCVCMQPGLINYGMTIGLLTDACTFAYLLHEISHIRSGPVYKSSYPCVSIGFYQ